MRNRWGKLLALLKFQRIRTRVLIAMIVISLPPLFLLGYVSFNTAKDTLMETNTQTNRDHLTASSEVADLLFKNITNLNFAMVLDNAIRGDLRLSGQIPDSEQAALRMRIQSQMQKVMNNNFLDSRYVESVCLYNLDFDAYCLGRSDDAGIYEGQEKRETIQRENWYRTALKAQGRVVFMGHNVLESTEDSFSSVKLYRDADNIEGETLGILVVNISSSIFDQIFVGAKSFGGTYLAVDTSADPARIIYPLKADLVPDLKAGSLGAVLDQLTAQGYLTSAYENYTTQWTFLHAVKTDMLLRQSNRIGVFTAVIGALIAVGAVILAYFISGGITRPLLRLKKMMVEWTKGARGTDQRFGTDEVGLIGNTFKRLAFENEELNHRLIHSTLKEREAELRALQAQINPHFLYNTLDSIYWMAKIENHQNIAKMAISLSHSFKLSLNKGKETILVYRELQHVDHYLTIQNIRYNHRFAIHRDIEESMMKVEILKLLLQPLVENAITHGLEPRVGPGTIWLKGYRDGDYLVFVVEDDGVGIDDMEKTDRGYGLRNVKERLTLYYGATSSFELTSELGKGTRVQLRFIPIKKEWMPDA
ncbi:sensor histidine kinase [Cohnella thailandensis]|uniref:Sensor histidine kinase n=1 Tax=Cohnella thailandensis TaxID=557557 RepID=A0A841T418_9BACL|nr:sensor histidine kinase [Cohnella thailandensis]MBB6636607.1 sensor histidine kinase [Cohnella thailandensis]MBP1973519.1 two-component system sensor histidine kinase YesM [Cohnella thailandensis]